MSRSRKQNSGEDLSLSEEKTTIAENRKQKDTTFKPNFFVPVHPVLMLGRCNAILDLYIN